MAAATKTMTDPASALVMVPTEARDWLIVLPVLLPLIVAAGLIVARHTLGRKPGLANAIALATCGFTLVATGLLLERVLSQGPLTMMMGRWLPPFGIAFTADALGAALALAASLATLLALVSERAEKPSPAPAYGSEPFALMLLAGVSGAFLTGDIFNLYVWFEVLLIASFGLLTLGPEKVQIDGTLKYGFLNLAGTTLFLIAVGLLYGLTGTLNMADLAGKLHGLTAGPVSTLFVLFFFAFGMKAAAFPVQYWLPAAYHTPRAATAGLFAALLTKVGIYGMLRVLVMLMPDSSDGLSLMVGILAAATMLFGALGTLAERDFRRLPGFVLISGIGTMLAGIALTSPGGLTGTIFYALQSMALMLALYLALFAAARLSGTADFTRAGGLYDRNPLLSALVLSLFFAASGLPPFSGFWPKALILKAALDIGAWWLAAALLVSGLLLSVGLARAFLIGFMKPAESIHPGGRLPLATLLPVALLTALVTLAGLYPAPLMDLAGGAAGGLADPAAYIHSVFPEAAP